MADLVDKDAALTIKVTGANTSGTETNFVNVDAQGSVQVLLKDANGDNLSTSSNRLLVNSIFNNDYTISSLGTLRVVEPQNVFESLFSFDKQPLIWDESLVSGGTSTHNSNTNSIDMTVPTTSGASVVRQTYRRIRYNPSRTAQVLMAGTLGSGKVSVRKRIGQFDTQDGLFFEQDETTFYVVRRSSATGSVIDTRVAQADWNIDKFDGTGISGITLDFSRHQLFYIQYAFQGFGDIVYGFYINGKVQFCHRETIANISTLPSLKTAHLPGRVEITNTGTSASSTTLSYNSFCIKHEGKDSDQEGQVRSYSDIPLKTISTTRTPVVSIRLRTGFEKAIVDLVKSTIFVNTADEVIWSIVADTTLTGSTFAINVSQVSLDTAATAMTGGEELISGILGQGSNSADLSQQLLNEINSFLGVSVAGSPRIITIAARSRAGTADVLSTLVWKEYP